MRLEITREASPGEKSHWNVRARAEIVVRLAHSFIVTPRADIALSTEADLMKFAHAHIVPIITGTR